uniref:cobalt-precorrin-5B (C(1))-methyltransferase CbiD n=1 Tax=Lachnospira sp. TaxID=2049031 RepID=UPI003FEDA085
MRCGYTTGTCACAAAKAAAQMLLSGRKTDKVKVMTPSGVSLLLDVEDISMNDTQVSCAIRKDSGDDPDVTNGIYVYAKVSYAEVYYDKRQNEQKNDKRIIVDGGKGVGRITKKGLSRPVGAAAINPVPLKMIEAGVMEAAEDYCYDGGLLVVISVPDGEEIAKKTFNPNLGITGGISILGTTGIVEPMSEQALIDTIRTEVSMHVAEGEKMLLAAPGNYGQDFLLNTLNIELKRSIKCSNYIGDTIDIVCASGAEGMLIVGHIGKLVKLGAGIMNTHSRIADGRMEVLTTCAVQAGAKPYVLRQLPVCVTTDAALEILKKSDMLEAVMEQLMMRIENVLERRSAGSIKIAAIVFSNEYGILGKTKLADELLEKIKDEA